MKAIQVHQFVSDFSKTDDSHISLNSAIPKPEKFKKDEVLVKVSACSISPGDVIMLQGNLIFLHQPFPFVPGMDICGTVEDANGHDEAFKVGDVVVASNDMTPVGGLAEYMVVKVSELKHKPTNVNRLEAAASSSAITARNAVVDHVQKGDRVLILGGSGGVGSAAIQIAKHVANAEFVATTSSQTEFCEKLGADMVIDYRESNWWEMQWEQKFDKIIDCVGGGNFYGRATNVLKCGKQGGQFVAVTGDVTKPDCRTAWKAIKFFASLPWRPLYTRLKSRTLPHYVLLMPYDVPNGRAQVLEWMEKEQLRIPLDSNNSPYEFTTEWVRAAFAKLASGHAHGKVVISIE